MSGPEHNFSSTEPGLDDVVDQPLYHLISGFRQIEH